MLQVVDGLGCGFPHALLPGTNSSVPLKQCFRRFRKGEVQTEWIDAGALGFIGSVGGPNALAGCRELQGRRSAPRVRETWHPPANTRDEA